MVLKKGRIPGKILLTKRETRTSKCTREYLALLWSLIQFLHTYKPSHSYPQNLGWKFLPHMSARPLKSIFSKEDMLCVPQGYYCFFDTPIFVIICCQNYPQKRNITCINNIVSSFHFCLYKKIIESIMFF